ncbi:MAG: DinB family protein [Armatimonadetes bacterium]|nr:DinB family protein [Armatimonadota bacterium]MBS1710601.1 DinB family protein [Armatimonadota bacterium]MBX3108272.1 DinB family protein [Fimbriimonadaceae bacterium]
MNNRYLLNALEAGPLSVARLMEAIGKDKWDGAEPGFFTPRETVAHLADCEPMLRARFAAAVQAPGSEVELFDEEAEAVNKNYAGSDVGQQLAAWKADREETLAFVRSVTDWSGHIIHPEQGRMGAESVICTVIGHDLYHIERLTRLLSDN